MTDSYVHHTRETLESSIPFHSYITLGLGMIVGVGWVVYSGQWLLDGGPLGAMLAFLIGGSLLIPVGMCYAELTSTLPLAGGVVSFAYKAFGSLVAFISGWSLALGYVAVAPFETIAIGTLLEQMIPAIASEALYHVGWGDSAERVAVSTILPGLLIGVFLIWLNYRGAREAARFQQAVVYAMIVCAAVFSVVALISGDVSNLFPLFASHSGATHGTAAAVASVISVLVVVPFFMQGFDAIAQAAEESGEQVPPRRLGVAILVSIASGAIFYMLIILAVSISMPWTESAQLEMTSAAVFEAAFGFVWVAKLVLFTALLGLITTLNGVYVGASRLLFSLGRGGLLHHFFAGVHPEHHTPRNALLFVGVISLIGPFVGKFALTPIVNCSAAVFTIALAITCLATIRLRFSHPDIERPYRAPLIALVIAPVVAIVLALLMVLPQSPGRLGNLEMIIIAVWLVLGFAAFYWRQVGHPVPKEERDYLMLGDFR